MTRPARALLFAAVLAALSCRSVSPPAAAVEAPRPPPEVPGQLLEQLSLLALGTLPSPELRSRAQGRGLEETVDLLLEEPGFARRMASDLIEPLRSGTPSLYTLKKHEAEGATVYYLRTPCRPEEAEQVSPWWDRSSTVRVCADSHQPTHLVQPETGIRCGGFVLAPHRSPYCGCGPNLVLCARDAQMARAVQASLLEELLATVASTIERDRPISEAFTGPETVRNGYSEAIYNQYRVMSGELAEAPDMSGWPWTEVRRAPRHESHPGEHAGILTTPQGLRSSDTPRPRMKNFYRLLWCEPLASSGVTTASVLALGVTDLRMGDGWRKLAAMPACTGCHARLDYGMQFFGAYGNVLTGQGFTPARLVEGEGELFAANIEDFRGKARLVAAGFAGLAVAQSEFGECMASHVTAAALDRRASVDEQVAVLDAFRRHGTVKAMMREALLRRARRTRAAPAVAAAPARPEVTARLAQLFEDGCASCHSEGPVSFSAGLPPRPVLQQMLTEVGSGNMPKSFGLMDLAERKEMVELLALALWPEDDLRAAALRPYAAHWQTPSYRADTLEELVARRAGMVPPAAPQRDAGGPSLLELTWDGQLGTGAMVGLAYEAAELCARHQDEADRTACLERALQPEPLLNLVH